jgi:hypothetical protein
MTDLEHRLLDALAELIAHDILRQQLQWSGEEETA